MYFQFRPWLPTEYLVDKWHNQCMDIWWCTNTFVHRLYYHTQILAVFTEDLASSLLIEGTYIPIFTGVLCDTMYVYVYVNISIN